MIEPLKDVKFGILIGLLAFLLGIGWAAFLVLGHESIHERLEHGAAYVASIKANAGEHAMPIAEHLKEGGLAGSAHAGLHDNPLMALAHTRLTRGHVHAMGLGLVTVVVSLAIAFTSAPAGIKKIVPALTGMGALVYPLAWIVMGYRTPAIGPEIAERSVSVVTLAGSGASLVLLGVLTAAVFIIKDIFKKS